MACHQGNKKRLDFCGIDVVDLEVWLEINILYKIIKFHNNEVGRYIFKLNKLKLA